MSELEFQFNERDRRGGPGRRRAAPPPRQQPPRQQPPRSSGPPRRKKKKKKKGRKGGRSGLAFFLVLLLFAILLGAGYFAFTMVQGWLSTPDYAGPGHGSVVVEVRPGDSGAAIATTLHQADVIASAQAFVEACSAAHPQCNNIQPGHYELHQQMRAADVVTILADPANRQVDWVTIPEGLSKFRTFALLSEQMGIPVEEFEQAEEQVLALLPDWWFNRNDDREAVRSIEGFLFPSTYDFPPDATAEAVLETMVNQFLAVTGELDFADRVQDERQITPFEALMAASIAQAEAGIEEDLGRVARVVYNRVYRAIMPLEMDVTTNYWLETQGEDPIHSGQMSHQLLNDPDNTYSTHARSGWMPGPINSPGRAALEAAMDPPEGDWLFFVAIDESTGESAFAVTYDEHLANIRIACQNGVPLSQC